MMETVPQKEEFEAQTVGTDEPPMPDGEGAARSLIVMPTGCYLLSLLTIYMMMELQDKIILFFLTGCLAATLTLFYLALMAVPEELRRRAGAASSEEGVSGRELFIMTARPLIQGLACAVALHCLLVLSLAAPKGMASDGKFAIFLCSCPMLALLLGGLLAPSLWVISPNRFTRVLRIAGLVFGWLVNYWVLFFMIATLTGQARFENIQDYFLFILALSAVLPGMIVYWAWIQAMIRLERDA